MPEFITVWDRTTGRKLEHRVPRDYLRIFPGLSETPMSKRRGGTKKTPATAPVAADTATSAPRAEDTTPQEESHAPQSD